MDAVCVELEQGVSLIPLTEQLYDDMEELSNLKDNSWPFEEFVYLSQSVLDLLNINPSKEELAIWKQIIRPKAQFALKANR